MKIDIISKPPPLPFGEGVDGFKLLLERYTGEQRLAVLDACMSGSPTLSGEASASLQALQFACHRVVADWENVCDANGTPIPIIREDEKGKRSVFGEFMGALPITMQLKVLAGIVAFMGIPVSAVRIPQLIEVFEKLGEGGRQNPTGSSGSATDSTASGG